MDEKERLKIQQSRHRRRFGHGPGHGMAPGEKPKDFKKAIKSLLHYIAIYKARLAFIVIFAIAGTVFNILGPKILGGAVTELYEGMMAKFTSGGVINFEKIGAILMGLIGLYLLASAFQGVMAWMLAGITQKIGFSLRGEISEKIGRMPMKYFESSSIGDVLSRITNDVDMTIQGLSQSITTVVTSIAMLIGVTIMMLSINPLMTLIVYILLPISLGIIAIVMKISQKHFATQQEYLGKVNGQVEETISGHNIVKLFNYEKESREEFLKTNNTLFNSAWKSQFLSGLMMPIMNFVGNLGYVGVVIAGGMLAFKGSITVGDIQAFIQYVRSFQQPLQQMAQIANMLQTTAAAAERVFAFLGEEEEVSDADSRHEIRDVKGVVDFSHVRFGYEPDKIIISDFNEEVEPGMTVAIVGPTGAGKTTLVKLLMRYYDVNGGSISLDGCDVRDLTRKNLRECFGMVLQDTWLFKGTIMENIRYGRLEATDEEVYEAARAAHIHRFIQTLPGGYQMELEEDAENISQGQRQLITIARAILADRPILILDEATSSVDTRTETLIQRAMNTLKKGRTSFVIAHRLSTIRDADLILVMTNGDIIEQGTHKELMANDGFYADLYNSQFDKAS